MIGKQPFSNPDYPKMITEKHYDQVLGLVQARRLSPAAAENGKLLQIAPTVLAGCKPGCAGDARGNFGPMLPVMTFGISARWMVRDGQAQPLAAVPVYKQQETARSDYGQSFLRRQLHQRYHHPSATSRMGFTAWGERHGPIMEKSFGKPSAMKSPL